MKTSLQVRKRKAAERVRLRDLAAKGKSKSSEVAIAKALSSSFYQLPFDVSHIRIQNTEHLD